MQETRTLAVTIDHPTTKGVTPVSIMKMVARSVDLKKIDVTLGKTCQTRTVGILLNVDSPVGANTLVEKVRQAEGDPSRTTDPYPAPQRAQLDNEADVRGGLDIIGVTSDESENMWLMEDDGCGYRTAVISIPYDVVIKVAQAGFVWSDVPGAGYDSLKESSRNASATRS